MSELEDIGRFHQLADKAKAALFRRDDHLSRVAAIIRAATEEPRSSAALGKRCNFDAIERIVSEARAEHEALLAMLDEMRALAPVANKPEPNLE